MATRESVACELPILGVAVTAGADIEPERPLAEVLADSGTVGVEGWALVLASYRTALSRADLSEHARRGYAARVARFLDWLSGDPDLGGGVDPLTDPHGRDFAVRDYRTFLKTVRRAKPATINAHLTALDHFYGSHLGLGRPVAKRERVPVTAPQALEEFEQRKLARCSRTCHQPQGRAFPQVRALGLATGIRGMTGPRLSLAQR
jgi:integrase/recombinase XerC